MKIKNLLLFLFPILLSAQNPPSSNWGQEFKYPYQDGHPLVVGVTDNHYFLHYKKRKQNKLLVYDFNHTCIATIPLGRNKDGKRIIAESIIKLKAGYFLVTSAYYKKQRLEFVYFSSIDKNGNVILSQNRLFASSIRKHDTIINLHYGVNPHNQDKYGFAISPDSTKILFSRVTGIEQSLRITGKDKYQLFVFDQALDKLWEKTISLPRTDRDINVEKFIITNKGNVNLFLKNKKIRGRIKNWVPNYDLLIFRVNENGIYASLPIYLPNSYPIVATGFCDENENLHIAGFYTNGKGPTKEMGVNGTYMIKFNQSDSLFFSKKIPFDGKLKKALQIEYIERSGFSFFNYEIDLLLIDYQKKEFLFVGENRYHSTHAGKHADDILIPSFSFDGDLNWIHHIPKKIAFKLSSLSNTNIYYKDDKIFLLCNGLKTIKELKQFKQKRHSLLEGFYTDLISINLAGEIESWENLFNSKLNKKLIHPRFCKDIGNGKYLIFTKGEIRNKMKFQFGTFEY